MDSRDERYGTAGYFCGTEPNGFLREHSSAIRRGGAFLLEAYTPAQLRSRARDGAGAHRA